MWVSGTGDDVDVVFQAVRGADADGDDACDGPGDECDMRAPQGTVVAVVTDDCAAGGGLLGGELATGPRVGDVAVEM